MAVIEPNSSECHNSKIFSIFTDIEHNFSMYRAHCLYISPVAASVSIFHDITCMIIRKVNLQGRCNIILFKALNKMTKQ